ncbi:hypothetical protein AB0L74_32665 [Streptomyces sp. NPDC052020]|uniref:hypothetical protein n=1 Tax=Streptomyces sp. NPDC052020 TaxID=3155677 RepID=UPI00342878A3
MSEADVLLRAVNGMYQRADCWRHEDDEDKLAWCRRDGTWQTCDRHRGSFARSLAAAAERWRRWTLPEQYPYAAGNAKGLHEVGCHIPRQSMPQEFSRTATASMSPTALWSLFHRTASCRQGRTAC